MEVGQPTKTPAYHREPVVPLAQPVKKPQPVKNTNTRNRDNKNKVNFNGGGAEDEKKREKYLTAKYGAHQMALIRKRLKVEMWIFDNLQELYETEVSVLLKFLHIWNILSFWWVTKNIYQYYSNLLVHWGSIFISVLNSNLKFIIIFECISFDLWKRECF